MIRAFIAIELNKEIVATLKSIEEKLMITGADVRWVTPSSIHLTLKFLGNVEEKMIVMISESAEAVAKKYTPFQLNVEKIGTFPARGNPRVIWVGVKEERDNLIKLKMDIEKEMVNLGFEREEREFTPHLTLGRVRSQKGREALLKKIEENRDLNLGSFYVNSFHLFRSDLHPQGAIYTKIKTFMLNLNYKRR